jgi:predicted Zn-dependent protease
VGGGLVRPGTRPSAAVSAFQPCHGTLLSRLPWLPACALLAVLQTAGCGARFAPPQVSPAELEAARLAVAEGVRPASGTYSAEQATVLLTSVSERLAAAAQPLCTTYLGQPCGFRISLDRSAMPSAALTGQGEVTITLGMMSLLGSEDEVAAVVGHEFGHQVAGHAGKRRARSLAAGTVAGTLLGAVVPFGGIAGWALGQGAAQIGSSATQLAFSKDEEREADYLSGYLVARAGYDLDRAGLVWVRLTRGGPNENAGWLDSHPAGPERLAAWRNTIDEMRASSDLVPRRPGRQPLRVP